MQNADYLKLFGDITSFSAGTSVVMADRQIKRGLSNGKVLLEEIGNAKAVIKFLPTNKWFIHSGGWENDNIPTAMFGAICGDVIGSIYEWHNIKYKPDTKKLVHPNAHFTDDTVMTCAVAEGLRTGLKKLPKNWIATPEHEEILLESIQNALILYGRKYPNAGYGGRFSSWLHSDDPKPYNSWGNGSAMRASYAGWLANTLYEAERLAELSAFVTHNHYAGIMGAKVVAGCIFLLRNGASKAEIRDYVNRFYELNFTLDDIREAYKFDVSCAGSVPHAILAFLENDSFADVIAAAISIGGDSDTIAAIAGSIAEVIYPIPQGIRGRVIDRLDKFLLNTVVEAVDFLHDRSTSGGRSPLI